MPSRNLFPRRGSEAPVIIHFLTDVHHGGITPAKAGKIADDCNSPNVPTPDVHLMGGDFTNEIPGITGVNRQTEDDLVKAFIQSIPDAPWRFGVGNHDIWQDKRTPAAYAAGCGQVADGSGAPNATYQDVDLGAVRAVILGVDRMDFAGAGNQTQMAVSDVGKTWLAARLAAAGDQRCVVFFHAPLKGTMLTDSALFPGENDSNSAGMFAVTESHRADDSELRQILADHPNAIGWVSGHVHPDQHFIDRVKREVIGGHGVATVCGLSPFFTIVSDPTAAYSPAFGIYLSVFSDRIEVRHRNHTARAWEAPRDKAVWTVRV